MYISWAATDRWGGSQEEGESMWADTFLHKKVWNWWVKADTGFLLTGKMLRVQNLLEAEAFHRQEKGKAVGGEFRVWDVHSKFCLTLSILAYFSVGKRRPCHFSCKRSLFWEDSLNFYCQEFNNLINVNMNNQTVLSLQQLLAISWNPSVCNLISVYRELWGCLYTHKCCLAMQHVWLWGT